MVEWVVEIHTAQRTFFFPSLLSSRLLHLCTHLYFSRLTSSRPISSPLVPSPSSHLVSFLLSTLVASLSVLLVYLFVSSLPIPTLWVADLVLDAEQRHVAVAVDMAVAERAEVFVGNGVRASPHSYRCRRWRWRVVADRGFGVGRGLVLELDGEYRDTAAGARDGGGEQPLPVRLGSPRHTSRARTRTRTRARTRRSYHIIPSSYHLHITFV